MDAELIEQLLHDSESSSLDFKRDQYPFDGATDEQKSELLKDILAFANAWRRAEAYIVIGVEDVQGGRSNPVGVSHHIDDAKLQQFVNGKTNRPISFSYQAIIVEGVQVAIISIEKQERPYFLKKDFGRLRKGVVYMRQGSSTKEADADEIYKMGRSDEARKQNEPVLDLQFSHPTINELLGNLLAISPEPARPLPANSVPDYPYNPHNFILGKLETYANANFYRELNEYFAFKKIMEPFALAVTNLSDQPALDVKLQMQIATDSGIILLCRTKAPKVPRKQRPILHHFEESDYEINSPFAPSGVQIEVRGNNYIVEVNFRKVQPKATVFSNGFAYIGAITSGNIELNGIMYSDNLPSPTKTTLTVVVQADKPVDVSVQMLLDIEKKLE